MTVVYWIAGVLIFLVVVSISVGLHEAGHMTVAKLLKIPVPKFFVGFGPTLWSKTYKGTEYGVKALPLGGFIQVEDRTQPKDSPDRMLLSYVAPWKRFLIFLAGPAVNIVLGISILFVLLMSTTQNVPGGTIATVNTCKAEAANCNAERAGFVKGDKILKVDGEKVKDFNLLTTHFKKEGSVIEVERGGQIKTLAVRPNAKGTIGISLGTVAKKRSASEASSVIGNFFTMNVEALARIPEQVGPTIKAIAGQEERGENSMSSIVGVGKVYGETAATTTMDNTSKFQTITLYTALLNLGLGLVNLLPLLPLDGGRILITFIDALKMAVAKAQRKAYRPLEARWVNVMTAVTGALVFGFSFLLIVADFVAPIKPL